MFDWLRNLIHDFQFRAQLYNYYVRGLLKAEPEKVLRHYGLKANFVVRDGVLYYRGSMEEGQS